MQRRGRSSDTNGRTPHAVPHPLPPVGHAPVMETARLQFAPIMGGRVPPKPPLSAHRGPGTPYNGGETPPNPPSSLWDAERAFFLPPRLASLALDKVKTNGSVGQRREIRKHHRNCGMVGWSGFYELDRSTRDLGRYVTSCWHTAHFIPRVMGIDGGGKARFSVTQKHWERNKQAQIRE